MSTGVVLSALLIIFTGWVIVDPIVTAHELDRRFGIKHATLQIEGGEEAECRLADAAPTQSPSPLSPYGVGCCCLRMNAAQTPVTECLKIQRRLFP